MKQPKQIPLTDNPRSKKVTLIPLKTNNALDTELKNEDNKQDYSESVQQLESESSD